MTAIAFKVSIHGQVQGVAFRATMLNEAKEAQISGWVKNCPDGTVEALIEGEASKIEKIVSWCQRGSQASRVDRVDVSACPLEGHKNFEIL